MIGSPWAVVLAGGDGARVSELTRHGDGEPTPKQFWRAGRGSAMVRWALARARRLVPPERTLVVVNAAHRRFWDGLFDDLPVRNILVQPANRGTAAGILLPLLTIQARAGADTPTVFLPSDHAVRDEAVLHAALASALTTAATARGSVVLLGMEPDEDVRDYGWVLPADAGTCVAVRRFLEKPSDARLRSVRQAGGLINSFMFASRASALEEVMAATVPRLAARFRAHERVPLGVCDLHDLYDAVETADFSRDVLQQAEPRLLVMRVPPCGWSDLGTPERLRAFLGPEASGRPAEAAAQRRTAAAA